MKTIDGIIYAILIIAVIWFIQAKFGKSLAQFWEWLKDTFKSRKKKESPSTYSYVDYD